MPFVLMSICDCINTPPGRKICKNGSRKTGCTSVWRKSRRYAPECKTCSSWDPRWQWKPYLGGEGRTKQCEEGWRKQTVRGFNSKFSSSHFCLLSPVTEQLSGSTITPVFHIYVHLYHCTQGSLQSMYAAHLILWKQFESRWWCG